MDAVRVGIRARERGRLGDLAFDGAGELDRIGCAQGWINRVGGRLRRGQRRDVRILCKQRSPSARIVGIDGYRYLLLVNAIEPLRLHDQILRKAIIEETEAGANNSLGRSV